MLKVPRYIPRCHATIQKFPLYNFGLPSGGAGTAKNVPCNNPNSPMLQFSAPLGHPKYENLLPGVFAAVVIGPQRPNVFLDFWARYNRLLYKASNLEDAL